MDNQELIHYLSIFVESQLFPDLRMLTEGTKMTKEEVEQEQQKQIIDFINQLPEEYKKMQNRDEIIANVLNRMKMKTTWVTKKLEELDRMKQVQSRNRAQGKQIKEAEER